MTASHNATLSVDFRAGHYLVRYSDLEYIIHLAITTVIGPKDTAASSVFEVTFVDYEKYLPYIYANEKLKMTDEDDDDEGEVEIQVGKKN